MNTTETSGKTALFAWEFGGHLGHIMNMLPLAKVLHARGYQINFALKDLSRANIIYDYNPAFKIFQAPVWTARAQGATIPPQTLAQILQRYGYKNSNAVEALVRAWLSIYDAVEPDLVVYDYTFTAQLAFRGLSAKQVTLGSGFFTPSFDEKTAELWVSENDTALQLEHDEASVLKVINVVCEKFKKEKLSFISDLNKVDANFLSTFPELDHYKERSYFNYYGPIIESARFAKLEWTETPGRKKIFAYLKPGPVTEKILKVLSRLDCEAKIFLPGLSAKLRHEYESERMQFSLNPYDIKMAALSSDLAICHAGHGTVATLLLYGCPLVLVPLQAEQSLLVRRTNDLGVSASIFANDSEALVGKTINKVLKNDAYKKAALHFSKKYNKFTKVDPVVKIADDIDELMMKCS
ncbi:hypothetical protein OAP18_02810 [Gammaproteobacteria bacterium]|nr:hypothetical protein [Gammaproteobacteria bacterium]